ncbi:MAG: sugar phosphate isomerase/epimerase [Deltaproteobacteria bacterium]|jgi:sugar phosphate isomerase/epimerase|nr:sugar phosphate isomerase/epimerase [Deltaproteobacteria bacterium]
MRLFATLYFRDIESGDSHYRLLQKLGYLPEIYFESGWRRLGLKEHKELAAKVRNELGGCSVHLPYRDLLPGRGEPETLETLKRAAGTAALYEPVHMVGHAVFRPLHDSASAPLKHLNMTGKELAGPLWDPNAAFLENSRRVWSGVLAECGARLFLENTSERSPFPLARLLETLPPERAAMCLDLGHWHHSGMGSAFHNLSEWISLAAEKIGHLHLHDNDGSADQHLSLGKGLIDFPLLKSLLRQNSLDPSATLENQTPEDLQESAEYLSRNPF